jgi:hypothetical protein
LVFLNLGHTARALKRKMSMKDVQYPGLKKFVLLYFGWYMEKPHPPLTAQIAAEIEFWEKRAPAKAKKIVSIWINDMVERSAHWSQEEVSVADRRLSENGAPTLSEVRKEFSKQYRKILKRGSIKTLEEYYLVKGIVDGGAVEVDATERANLFSMLGTFESYGELGPPE